MKDRRNRDKVGEARRREILEDGKGEGQKTRDTSENGKKVRDRNKE